MRPGIGRTLLAAFGLGLFLAATALCQVTITPIEEAPSEPEPEPLIGTVERGGVLVVELEVDRITPGGMGILTIRAAAPGTDWSRPGAEAAVLEVGHEGRLLGRLVLFMGGEFFDYRLLAPALLDPAARIEIFMDPELSAPAALEAAVAAVEYEAVGPGDPRHGVLSHAPILYGRDDNNVSDVPLYSWVEAGARNGNTVFTYNVVWSNEDGGTQTLALMSRWGRTVDIEWVNEVELDQSGMSVRQVFQGEDHRSREFGGVYRGLRPVYRTCTNNNMVCDDGVGALRFSLVPELRAVETVRESVLDERPWIMETAFKELLREGKAVADRPPIAPMVQDPRNYLYIDWKISNPGGERVFAAAARLKGSGYWHRSDWGIKDLRIGRSGWGRTAILLGPGVTPDELESVRLLTDADPESDYAPVAVEALGLMMLDRGFAPVRIGLEGFAPFKLYEPRSHKDFAPVFPFPNP